MEVGTVFWKILNFSCWHEAMHERSIVSPSVVGSCSEEIDLYPKGDDNDEEHLEVVFTNIVTDFTCEVFFYGPDRSIIHKLKGSAKTGQSNVKLPPGPKFEDVVAHIRSKIPDPSLKDCLTLEFRFKNTGPNSVHKPYPELRFCTTIEVCEIRSDIELKFLAASKTDPLIIYSDYVKKVSLKNVSENDDEVNVQLTLVCYECGDFGVKSILNYENSTGVHLPIINEGIALSDEAPLTVGNILGVKDLIRQNTIVLFYFKIISGNSFQSYEFVFRQLPTKQKNKQGGTLAKCSVDDLVEIIFSLYKSLPLPDFQLRCQNISLPAHKSILSENSPVFRDMLTRQPESNYMDVDLDVQTLAGLLIYLYTKKMDHLQWKEILNLFDAAHQYQIDSLKEKCVSFLCANFSVRNVIEILVSGDKHKEIRLVSAARSFISFNNKEVRDSEEWKKALATKSKVILEANAHAEAFKRMLSFRNQND